MSNSMMADQPRKTCPAYLARIDDRREHGVRRTIRYVRAGAPCPPEWRGPRVPVGTTDGPSPRSHWQERDSGRRRGSRRRCRCISRPRIPAIGEVLIAGIDEFLRCWRKHRQVLPDRRTGESDHHVDAQQSGGASGVLHLLGGADRPPACSRSSAGAPPRLSRCRSAARTSPDRPLVRRGRGPE